MTSKLTKSICLFLYFVSLSLMSNLLQLEAKNIKEASIRDQYKIEKDLIEDRYILGPGDKIKINFLELKEFSGEYLIMSDGILNLPLIGSVSAKYLTLEKLTKKLINLYGKELIRPDLYISVIQKRPIFVSVLGEINSPGLYKLYNIDNVNAPNTSETLSKSFISLPTVVDAISSAGGITPNSNIKSVSVKRLVIGEEKTYKNISINLVNLLMKGDQSQNLILFDGDIITIKRVKKNEFLSKETLKIAKGNLSPKMIKINVIGAVEKPGDYDVKSNTTLNKAILLANGFVTWKSNKTNIQLFRINSNGSITNKKYKFDINEKASDDKNPTLKDGDIIKVNTTGFSKIKGGIKEISSPLTNILTPYYFLKLISE